jgi:hypothetical protein
MVDSELSETVLVMRALSGIGEPWSLFFYRRCGDGSCNSQFTRLGGVRWRALAPVLPTGAARA